MGNDVKMVPLESNGRRWSKRAAAILGRALFVCMIIVAYTWIDHRLDSNSGKFSMRLSHEQGPENRASRCPGDCSQIGDTYTAITSGGSSDSITSIYAFVQNRLLAACEDCTILSIVIQSVGKFDIVGALHTKRCTVDKSNFDSLAASAMRCGAIEYSSFEVR